MVSGSHKNILRDESGAVLIEFTAAAFTFFIILFGVVEFANVYYQWNAATKAAQLGARLAAVSDPVSDNLTEAGMSGLSSSVLPGNPMPSFDCLCDGSSSTCTGTVPAGASDCNYNAAAMDVLVYGRGNTTGTCVNTGANIGMCNIFTRVTPQNVIVRYQYTGLGYAGRPGGPVPTITVSLTGLTYDWILIGALTGFSPINLPSFATTVTGEDLNVSGS